MEQTTIDITVGDVRKSSDSFCDAHNCHLCNAVRRVIGIREVTVNSDEILRDYKLIGHITPAYIPDHYRTDKSFVNSNPSLPDTHIIRTLQFKPI